MDETLLERIVPVMRRLRFRRVWLVLGITWYLVATIVACMTFAGYFDVMVPRYRVGLVASIASLFTLFAWLGAFAYAPGFSKVGRLIEAQFPDLDSRLITAIEMRPLGSAGYSFLQQDVMRQAFAHSLTHRWNQVVPGWQLFFTPLVSMLSLTLLIVATLVSMLHAPEKAEPATYEDLMLDPTQLTVSVEPGSTEVERGSSLLVLARYEGGVPPEVDLQYELLEQPSVTASSDDTPPEATSETRSMKRGLDDPIFGSRIATITQPLRYRIKYLEEVTQWYEVQIFEYPTMLRADAQIQYPDYTKLSPKLIPDFQRLSAVAGSQVKVTFHLNKPVQQALLKCVEYGERRDGLSEYEIRTQQIAAEGISYEAIIPLEESCRYELVLTDEDGRQNKLPPRFTLTSLPNQPPAIKILSPGRDLEASALEEVNIATQVWDDFSVVRTGLTINRPNQVPDEILLGESMPGNLEHLVTHLLALEQWNVQPDDLVSYHVWAEDLDQQGQQRRVYSDLFFLEIRPFDQIFRQGQQPTAGQMAQQQQQQMQGQQSNEGQQAQEMAEQQKQIISASWNLQRKRLLSSKPMNQANELQVVQDAQMQNLEQMLQVAQEVDDPVSQKHADSATENMSQSADRLKSLVTQSGDMSKLYQQAIQFQQAAYQDLLRLREREFEVVQQQQQMQQQQSQSQSNSRSQQQMQQLNLEVDENRYEDERTAQDQPTSQEQQEAREDRQVLNRLRELAQRQEDLVDKINELQSAIQQAETAEEKEEMERRLKSLQDQQRDLLRDADELSERMQQQQNQQRMGQQQQELQQARQGMQNASEALQNQQLSQAAADASRAQNQLDELKEEFQRRTSSQFEEALQQMRNEARDIEQKQDEIRQQMNGEQEISSRPGLTEDPQDASLLELLKEQEQRIDQLSEKIKETIQEAETTEPLLAEDLYETYRRTEQQKPGEQLREAANNWERGWQEEAERQAEQAAESLSQLREGIESAAESVLGDEVQSLKAARDTLEQLREQVEAERRANSGPDSETGQQQNPEGQRPENGNTPETNRAEDGQGQANQRQEGGQPQDGQTPTEQPGDRERGQREQGQGEGQQPADSEANPRGQSGQQGSEESTQRQSRNGEGEQPSEDFQPGQQSGSGGQQGNPQPGTNNQDDNGEPRQQNGQNRREDANQTQNQGRDGQGQNGDRIQDMLNQISPNRGGFAPNRGGDTGNGPVQSPLTGEDYRQWVDQLRDVEEMVTDPELRAEAARIREEAQEIRRDLKRHSQDPNWDLVQLEIVRPLQNLQDRVTEEILRRSSDREMVRTDRDPVPSQYQDAVQRYYERLGIGK